MYDFQLLVGRMRSMVVYELRRAYAALSGSLSTWPARLVSLRSPEGRQAIARSAFPLLGFAAAYLAAYVYGNGLPSPAPLWPPDAILLSALLLVPPRRWWIYVLITLPIRMLPALAPGVPGWLLIVNWLNDTLKALLAAVLVRHFAPRPLGFMTLRAMGIYLLSAALISPLLSAIIGAAGLAALGAPYWQTWRTWFLGDALASLILTPTIVMWVTASKSGLRPVSRERGTEALLLGAALLVVGGLLVFSRIALVMDDAIYYLPIPLLVWAAVRHGPRGTASALTVVTCFAVASGVGFWGLETSTSTPRDVLSLQLFLIATAVPLLLLAAQIEERKQTVKKVERQAEELDRVFEAVGDGLVVYDREGRELRANSALHRLLGLEAAPPEYAQMPLPERTLLFGVRDEQGRPLAPDAGPLQRALADEAPVGAQAMDVRVRTLDGRELELNVSAAPLRDVAGELVGVVCVFRDQTERNQLVREREEARANELALREVNQQLDTFVAMAAHDLRQPVAAAKLVIDRVDRQVRKAAGKAQLATAKPMVPVTQVEAALNEARGNLDRLWHLVERLLDVTQARQGILTLNREPCRLEDIVAAAVEEQRLLTPKRILRLDLPQLGNLPVMVDADAQRLGQVLSNYLANAVRYSPADLPIEVALRMVEPPPDDGALVQVAVRDYGSGIAPEECITIWDRFQRARSTNEGGVGLGLGLYIARTIIERHGGHVGVESTVGEGSTFWFTLPLAPSKAADAALSSEPSADPPRRDDMAS